MNKEIKFVASYSGGKDSALALYRAIQRGYEPISLLTTYNETAGRSWFHGVPADVLQKVALKMEIPIQLVKTDPGEDYGKDFEKALFNFKEQGTNACVFGDIDIQDHYDWCNARCEAVNIGSIFPLWQESRKDVVYEFIDSGFKAVITIVNASILDESFLGKILTKEILEEIAAKGADICGENGEYHTFVYDGPLFKEPVPFQLDEIKKNGNYAIRPLSLK